MPRDIKRAQITKLFGPKARYRVNTHALSAADRQKAVIALRDARLSESLARAGWEARRRELFQDATYIALEQALLAARVKREETQGLVAARRYTIGRDEGWAFFIDGEGDTWEEAIAAATKEKI